VLAVEAVAVELDAPRRGAREVASGATSAGARSPPSRASTWSPRGGQRGDVGRREVAAVVRLDVGRRDLAR
jgi:hypothetical protein